MSLFMLWLHFCNIKDNYNLLSSELRFKIVITVKSFHRLRAAV